jgi:arylsulfatase A-like enzyme
MVNIDWAPTLLDIAGVQAPAGMQGASFLPLVKGDTAGWRKAAYYHYYEFPQPHHVYPHFGIRTEKYTLVHFYDQTNAWELYDLQADPQEMHNLYGQPAYKQVTDALKQQLRQLIKQYKDEEALQLMDGE